MKAMPKKIQLNYFKKALDLLNEIEQETKRLLLEHENELRTVAHELQQRKTLSARTIKLILRKRNSAPVS